jgi:putative transposase
MIGMPRNARCVEAGLAYHVTQRGSNRQRVFYCASDYRMYLSLLGEQLEHAGVRVLAYCLMTNHVHLVVVPERAESLAVLFRRVHGRYSQYLNTRRRRTGHLWQQRYFSCPLAGSHVWVALRYVEENPCRANIVRTAADYKWSSARAHLGLEADKTKLLDQEFWERSGGSDTWRQMHGASDEPDRILLLRRCTYAGRPFGDEEFVQRLEERFRRNWRRWGFEKLAVGASN